MVERLHAIGTPWVCDLDELLTDVPAFSTHHFALRGGADLAVHDDSLEPCATLVVASSDTVLIDFVVWALRALARKPGLQILAIGPIHARLTTGFAVQSRPLLTRTLFQNLLAACVNPIGLIPLDDSAFSSGKSPIEVLDYALAAMPALWSRVSSYVEVVDDGRRGQPVKNDQQAGHPRRWN